MKIAARARIIEPIKVQLVIRKIETDDNDRFIAKYGLSKTNEWIKIPEGERYPDECLFDTEVSYEPFLNFDTHLYFDNVEIVARALDGAERQGSDEDGPEGQRYATFSDTLLKQLSARLWRLIWPS